MIIRAECHWLPACVGMTKNVATTTSSLPDHESGCFLSDSQQFAQPDAFRIHRAVGHEYRKFPAHGGTLLVNAAAHVVAQCNAATTPRLGALHAGAKRRDLRAQFSRHEPTGLGVEFTVIERHPKITAARAAIRTGIVRPGHVVVDATILGKDTDL